MSDKQFPEGMEPLGKSSFRFGCHPRVACYKSCCRDLHMTLYPYDIIRLKNGLGITAAEFLQRYTVIGRGSNPYFPSLSMKMADNEEKTCPFLGEGGCLVYKDRPSACRTYPLERAVDRSPQRGRPEEFYFLTSHPYCKGHMEETEWTVREWLRDQWVQEFNNMNDLWAEVDTVLTANPFKGEGAGGPKQQMAFMVCYNIDGFRQFVAESGLLDRFSLDKARRKLIRKSDDELQKFGFDWLKFSLAGQPTLVPKR